MATQVQFRRGTTPQHAAFTGALGELTIDTDKDTLVVHDGTTVGGFPLLREIVQDTNPALGGDLASDIIPEMTGGVGNVSTRVLGSASQRFSTLRVNDIVVGDASGIIAFEDGATTSPPSISVDGNSLVIETDSDSVDVRSRMTFYDATTANAPYIESDGDNLVIDTIGSAIVLQSYTHVSTAASPVSHGVYPLQVHGDMICVENSPRYVTKDLDGSHPNAVGHMEWLDTNSIRMGYVGCGSGVDNAVTLEATRGDGYLRFNTGGVGDRVRITSNGVMLIGTPAETPGVGLKVANGELFVTDGAIRQEDPTVLGAVAGDEVLLSSFRGESGATHTTYLQTKLYRKSAGTAWNEAAMRFQCVTDVTSQGYIDFNGDNDHGITFGTGNPLRDILILQNDGIVATTGGGIQSRREGAPHEYIEIDNLLAAGHTLRGVTEENNKKPLYIETLYQPTGSPAGVNRIIFRMGDYTAPTEVGRFEDNGVFYMGSGGTTPWDNTSNGSFAVYQDGHISSARENDVPASFNRMGTDGNITNFHKDGTLIGNISITAAAVSYNNTSDYRLKENIYPIVNALDKMDSVNPVSFNFKVEPDKTVEGFIAHELKEAAPYAVTGDKNAVHENGDIDPQQVDYGRVTPLLAAAIKELKEENEALKFSINNLVERINALENA